MMSTRPAAFCRARGMSDAAFEEWAARLVIVGDEAFLPEEVDGTVWPYCEPPIKTCRRCGRQYIRQSYGEHADAHHNDGPRTAYWREQGRIKRERKERKERGAAA